ncbi:MAG: carbon-nitrogen hydrolase family protein [Pseudohongiella sp.]|nr:carbon-nitrogen hydrolase family protein [Pseudohongiella sp.]MDO9521401.1 carbon-nitrogen hydrolase family protein [Pseudohongiella sp.]MDP2126137.1 carbon-nitrogen hydrolase family protein [Pseudohongiella sp.]
MTSKFQRIAAVQMVSTADININMASAERLVTEAAERGAGMVVLPENFAVLDGGPQARFAEREGDLAAPLQGLLSRLAQQFGIWLVGGTIPLITRPPRAGQAVTELTDGRVRPASLVFNPVGELAARYDKMHLFDVEVSDRQSRYAESDSFEAGDAPVWLDTDCGRLGLSICYDIRFPELYRHYFASTVDLITVPSAFTRVTGEAHWEVLLRARAIENQCYMIGAGQGGVHNERRETFGHSMIVDPWGRVLDVLEAGEGVVVADMDHAALRDIRQRMPVFKHRRMGKN